MNTTSLASALDSLFGTISTCDSIFAKNGSTKGLISAANLASVLGVGSAKTMGITEGSVSDLNNEIGSTNTFYIKFCTPSSAPANVPANLSNKTRFFLEVINDSSYYILQKVYGPTSNDAWFRIKNGSTWNAWAQM